MYQIFLIIFVVIAIVLIILIMLQQSKHNNSSGMFEYRSLENILNPGSFGGGITRLIIILAVLFFLFSLLLGNMNSKHNSMSTHIEHAENILQDK